MSFRCFACRLPTDDRFQRTLDFNGVTVSVCIKCFRDYQKRQTDLEMIAQEVAYAESLRESKEVHKLETENGQSTKENGQSTKEDGEAGQNLHSGLH